MKIPLWLFLFLSFSIPAWSQSTPTNGSSNIYTQLNEIATREKIVLLFADHLEEEFISKIIKNEKVHSPLTLIDVLDTATAVPIDIHRFGRFISFKRKVFDSPEAVPCITMTEGDALIHAIEKICRPYQSTIDISTDELSRKRLLKLFTLPVAEKTQLTSEDKTRKISERQEIRVSDLNSDDKNLVWQFLLSRYSESATYDFNKAIKQFSHFSKGQPKFGYLELAGVTMFGYTSAPDFSVKNRSLYHPFSHPDNLIDYYGNYGMQRFTFNGRPQPVLDATAPTDGTKQWLASRYPTETTTSFLKRANFPPALTVSETLADKQFTAFGETPNSTTADYIDFGHAFGFLFDLSVQTDTNGICTVQPKRVKVLPSIVTLNSALIELLPDQLLLAVESVRAQQKATLKATPPPLDQTVNTLQNAIKELRSRAVRRLRGTVEPMIERSPEHSAHYSQLGTEERNMLSFILLTPSLSRVCTLLDTPLPSFISHFDEVTLLREVVTDSNGKSIMLNMEVHGKDDKKEQFFGMVVPAEN